MSNLIIKVVPSRLIFHSLAAAVLFVAPLQHSSELVVLLPFSLCLLCTLCHHLYTFAIWDALLLFLYFYQVPGIILAHGVFHNTCSSVCYFLALLALSSACFSASTPFLYHILALLCHVHNVWALFYLQEFHSGLGYLLYLQILVAFSKVNVVFPLV